MDNTKKYDLNSQSGLNQYLRDNKTKYTFNKNGKKWVVIETVKNFRGITDDRPNNMLTDKVNIFYYNKDLPRDIYTPTGYPSVIDLQTSNDRYGFGGPEVEDPNDRSKDVPLTAYNNYKPPSSSGEGVYTGPWGGRRSRKSKKSRKSYKKSRKSKKSRKTRR